MWGWWEVRSMWKGVTVSTPSLIYGYSFVRSISRIPPPFLLCPEFQALLSWTTPNWRTYCVACYFAFTTAAITFSAGNTSEATHSLGHGNFSFWEIVKISNAQKTYFLSEKRNFCFIVKASLLVSFWSDHSIKTFCLVAFSLKAVKMSGFIFALWHFPSRLFKNGWVCFSPCGIFPQGYLESYVYGFIELALFLTVS